jgi:NADPH:quinone reductase-like Zn-dependent oxidoreductase
VPREGSAPPRPSSPTATRSTSSAQWTSSQIRWADLAFDSVGGPEFEELAQALVPGGAVIVYGWLNPDRPLLPRNWPQTIHTYANYALMADPKVRRRTVHFINAGLRSGSLKPVIDRVYEGIEQVADAHRRMESNEQFGKIVVTVRH